jgi:tRNA dimethylallyltransferase
MMEAGFLEEAKSVHAYKSHNALQTVGYKEFFDFLEGKCTLEEAVSLIKLHTRQYAKRQLTFFNKNDDYHWFHPSEIPQLLQFLKETIR